MAVTEIARGIDDLYLEKTGSTNAANSKNTFDDWLNNACETSFRAKSTIILLQAIYAKDKREREKG